MRYIPSFLLCFLSISFTFAQSKLSIETIMQGEDFVGALPQYPTWSFDNETIYFQWKRDGDEIYYWYKIKKDAALNAAEKVNAEEERLIPSNNVIYNKARSKAVYERFGDIILYDVKEGSYQFVTETNAYEQNPQFLASQNRIVYQVNNNLWVWDMKTGATKQLTDFQQKAEPKQTPPDEHAQFLINDQAQYFDVLTDRETINQARRTQEDNRKTYRPKTIYTNDYKLYDMVLSPNERFVVFQTYKNFAQPKTEVPDYVTNSGYTEMLNARAKVGGTDTHYKLGIYDRKLDTVYYYNVDAMEDIFEKPAYRKTEYNDAAPYETPRHVIFHGFQFSEQGKLLMEAKAMDNKDRWLFVLDLEDKTTIWLDHQKDDAWIGGPGISSWNSVGGNIGWTMDGYHVYYQSEVSGFSHLYLINISNLEKTTLTEGNYEVHEAFISKDGLFFYLNTSEVDAGERHFYKMPVRGGEKLRLTQQEGQYEVSLSPNEEYLALRYSNYNTPWELYTKKTEENADLVALTSSTTAAFQEYDWKIPELVYFEAEDGEKVRARLYKPSKKKANKAGVIFVHGAGYLQNAHKGWSLYFREYMFHNFLVDNGYTVLDIDYRASSGYGREWRTGIYRHMGGKDLSDQVDGAKYLVEEQGIRSDKLGIYGGSYGGFITLMAMFTEPDVFQCGAALRSVTDWAHYNHPYTANILNTPALDSTAYRKSSPIYFAEGLKGKLLILHGMIDTNVQFQDVVRLSQRLIELGKKDWELAVFPLEGHGFKEASSWTDEYSRIFKLFEENLR